MTKNKPYLTADEKYIIKLLAKIKRLKNKQKSAFKRLNQYHTKIAKSYLKKKNKPKHIKVNHCKGCYKLEKENKKLKDRIRFVSKELAQMNNDLADDIRDMVNVL